jgi:cold shock CspA family protein
MRALPCCRQPAKSLDYACRPSEAAAPSHLLGREVRPVTHGKIVRLVRSYGSRWGRIQPSGTEREIFFNHGSLPEDSDFADLREGQVVEFDEEPDRANGTHAINVIVGDLPTMAESK